MLLISLEKKSRVEWVLKANAATCKTCRRFYYGSGVISRIYFKSTPVFFCDFHRVLWHRRGSIPLLDLTLRSKHLFTSLDSNKWRGSDDGINTNLGSILDVKCTHTCYL